MTMNEIDLMKKIIIILIVVNFVTGIFYALTNSALNVPSSTNTALNKLNTIGNQSQTYSTSLTNSFSYQVYNTTGVSLTILNAPQTIGAWIVNFVAKVIVFVSSLFLLVGLSFYTVIVMVFQIIPSLFIGGAFGVFNYIAVIIYGFLIFLVSIYGVYLILDIWGRVK